MTLSLRCELLVGFRIYSYLSAGCQQITGLFCDCAGGVETATKLVTQQRCNMSCHFFRWQFKCGVLKHRKNKCSPVNIQTQEKSMNSSNRITELHYNVFTDRIV